VPAFDAASAYLIDITWGGLLAKPSPIESKEPEHVALQTRQDVAAIFTCLTITNALLAAILAALIYK
jgi:hypothetical protein